MDRGRFPLLVLASGALMAFGCNSIQDILPTQPTPSASPKPQATRPALTIPVILPKAAPTPAPTPLPTLAPLPPPAANPAPPASGSCSLPAMDPNRASCAKTSPQLLGKLEKAITNATQARPEFFDMNDKKCDNCYRVKNEAGYFNEVQRQLAALGVCSEVDADEIGIKADNKLSEWYDIYLGTGHIRRGSGAYMYGCNPANF